jgi:hypothetical protein
MFAIRIYLSALTLMFLVSLLRREASPSWKPQ